MKFIHQKSNMPRMPIRIGHLAGVASIIAIGSALVGCILVSGWSSGADSPRLPPGPGVTIYAAGDIAECRNRPPQESGAARTAALIEAGFAQDPNAAVLTLGDVTYPDGFISEFTGCYHPTWGRFKQRTFPSPGNHEYNTPQAAGYYNYFGDAAGPDRRGYYSFDLGAWHIVSLNSNLQPAGMKKQLEWLKADLAAHPRRCTLAYSHHPYYSSGGHGNNPFMRDTWEVLQAAGADVLLSGHDHDYERFAPQNADGYRDDKRGMRQFVVGTGGARLTPFLMRKENSEAAYNETFGVLRMTLKETGYEWEFLPTSVGDFIDKGAASCH